MSNHNNSSNSNGSGGGGGGGGGGDSGDSCCISPRPVDFGTRLCKKEGGSSGGEPGLLSEMESAAKEVFGKAARTNDLQALDRIADDMVKTVREGAREAFAKSPASQASASRAFILCLIDFIVKMFHLQSPNHETRAAAEKVIRDLSSIQKSSPADSASSLPPSPKPSFELPQDVVSLLSTLSQPAQQQQQQQQQHQHSSSPPPPPPAQLKPKTAVKIQTVQKKSLPRPGGRSASMSAGTLTSSGRKTAPAPPPRMTVMATSPQSSLAHQPTKKQPPQTPPPVKKQLPQPPPPMQQTVATTTTTTATATAAGGGATATVATPLSSPNACTLRSKSVKVQGKPLPGVPRPLSERKAKSATKDDLFVGQHSADYDCIAQCLTLKLQQQQQQQQQHTSLKGFDDGGNSGKKAVRSDTPNESADDENESGSATPNSSSEPVAKDEKTKKKTGLKGLFRGKNRKGSRSANNGSEHVSDNESDGEDSGDLIQQSSSGGMKIVMLRSSINDNVGGCDDGKESEGGSGNVESSEPKTKRDYITDEIISTEKTYVEGLRILTQIYEQPMRAKQILSDEDVNTIFTNTQKLYEIHSKLLSELKGNKDRFGEIFLANIPLFEAYKTYGKGYFDGNALASKYKKTNSDFKKFLSEQGKSHSSVVSLDLLESLLITPIQRIPRYNLLLADLIKNTGEDHPDLPSLREALKQMIEMAEQVNLAIKFTENQKKLAQIQQLILFSEVDEFDKKKMGPLVQDHRMFVREGDLTMKDTKGVKQGTHMFLFNDMILVTKKKLLTSQYTFLLYEPLETSVVEEVPKSPDNSTYKFSLTSPRGKYIFSLQTQDERDDWVRTIDAQLTIWNLIITEKTKIIMKMKNDQIPQEEMFKKSFQYYQKMLNKSSGNATTTTTTAAASSPSPIASTVIDSVTNSNSASVTTETTSESATSQQRN